jgi:hypothetical protein
MCTACIEVLSHAQVLGTTKTILRWSQETHHRFVHHFGACTLHFFIQGSCSLYFTVEHKWHGIIVCFRYVCFGFFYSLKCKDFLIYLVFVLVIVKELIVLGTHGLHVLGELGPFCVGRLNLLSINMYTCSLN